MIDFQERNYGCRGRQVIYHGLQTLMIENEQIRLTILADKGTDILEFLYKPADVDFLWRSPLGLKDPARFVPSIARSDGAFMDYYEGGWLECLPHGGMAASYKGAEFGQTGEVALIPWEYAIVEDSPNRIEVLFQVRTYRTPFLLRKWLRLERGEPVLFIKETLCNEGAEEMDLMWCHHPVFGPPFLDDSCIIETNGRRVRTLEGTWFEHSRLEPGRTSQWPFGIGHDEKAVDLSRVPAPGSGTADLAFIDEFDGGTAWYALTNCGRGVGIAFAWPRERYPYLVNWQDYNGSAGQPWYGRIYCTALEMWSSYPVGLPEVIKAGTQIRLQPGEVIESQLVAVAFAARTMVRGVTLAGAVL
jgi:hypothetical protein